MVARAPATSRRTNSSGRSSLGRTPERRKGRNRLIGIAVAVVVIGVTFLFLLPQITVPQGRLECPPGHVLGVDRRSCRRGGPQRRDERAALDGRAARARLPAGAPRHAGVHRPLDGRTGRSGGRNGDVLRDAERLGAQGSGHRSCSPRHRCLEPACHLRLPDHCRRGPLRGWQSEQRRSSGWR